MAGVQRRPIDIGTLSTPEIIQKALTDFTREDLYIALPATVVGVDDYETMQCVDVRGLINDVYEDEAIIQAVKISKVFVKLPAGGDFSQSYPIAVGDLVTLHWAHRNLNTFLDNAGQAVEEPINMVADIRDCWVTHGFGTRSNNQSPSKTDYITRCKNTTIIIKPDGNISIVTASDVSIETTGNINGKCAKAILDTPLVETTGDLKVGGNLEVVGNSMTVAGVEVYAHDHTATVPPMT
jgi:hypothetical protein